MPFIEFALGFAADVEVNSIGSFGILRHRTSLYEVPGRVISQVIMPSLILSIIRLLDLKNDPCFHTKESDPSSKNLEN